MRLSMAKQPLKQKITALKLKAKLKLYKLTTKFCRAHAEIRKALLLLTGIAVKDLNDVVNSIGKHIRLDDEACLHVSNSIITLHWHIGL